MDSKSIDIGKTAARTMRIFKEPDGWAVDLREELALEISRAYEKAIMDGSDPVEYICVTYGMTLVNAWASVRNVENARKAAT